MKKSILLATALTAAALTVSLTACDSTNFILADYAADLAESSVYADATLFTKSEKIADASATAIGKNFVRVPGNQNDTYKLYDLAKKTYPLGDNEYNGITLNTPFIYLQKSITTSDTDADTKTGFDLTDLTAKIVLENVLGTPKVSSSRYTVGEEYRYVNAVEYSNAADESLTKYFTYTDPDKNGNGTALKECDKYEFSEKAVTAGESFNIEDTLDLGEHVKDLAGYSLTQNATANGTIFTFIKDGKIKGTLSFGESDEMLGIFEESFYYVHKESVAENAAKGYNVIEQTDSRDYKYNYTYYRYNILKDKLTEVKTDYVFTAIEAVSLYNYATQSYDRAIVTAVKFENGVAVLNDSAQTRLLIIEKGLKVYADFTDKIYSPKGIVKIAENRYLAAGANGNMTRTYLLDGNENVLAAYPVSMSAIKVYENSSRIVCSYNGYYMATDFDGKVVMENLYDSLNFYGNYAYAKVDDEYLVISSANPEGKTIEAIVGNQGDETDQYDSVVFQSGLIKAYDSTNKKYVFFDLSGKEIFTLDNVISYYSVTVAQADGGKYLLINASVDQDGTAKQVSYFLY